MERNLAELTITELEWLLENTVDEEFYAVQTELANRGA